jgi:hypothetical protein
MICGSGLRHRKTVQVKSKVYLETTILSYLAARKSKDPRAAERQSVIRRWWDLKRNNFEAPERRRMG